MKRPTRSIPKVMRPHEIRGLQTAVSFMTAGEAGGVPDAVVQSAESALAKLCQAPEQAIWIAFSRKELELLWLALGNGAGDDSGDNLGLRADEKKTLGAAANRIANAGALGGPQFYE